MSQHYQTQIFHLQTEHQRPSLLKKVETAPIGIEIVFRKKQNKRKESQNALMWAGPLKDMHVQAWPAGQQFSEDAWHYQFKVWFLPEEYEEGITEDGYAKYEYAPNGDRILVGSTTQLTTKGFGIYLEKIYAYGATEFGVQFGVDERRFA